MPKKTKTKKSKPKKHRTEVALNAPRKKAKPVKGNKKKLEKLSELEKVQRQLKANDDSSSDLYIKKEKIMDQLNISMR